MLSQLHYLGPAVQQIVTMAQKTLHHSYYSRPRIGYIEGELSVGLPLGLSSGQFLSLVVIGILCVFHGVVRLPCIRR